MNLLERSTFPDLNWIRRELDEFWKPLSLAKGGESLAAWSPAVDIEEDENTITIKADLPEVDRKDIHVDIENDTLTITGERKREKEEKKKRYHRVERSHRSYMRSFSLPEYAEQDKIKAEARNGVLTVTIPKKPGAKSETKAIEVK